MPYESRVCSPLVSTEREGWEGQTLRRYLLELQPARVGAPAEQGPHPAITQQRSPAMTSRRHKTCPGLKARQGWGRRAHEAGELPHASPFLNVSCCIPREAGMNPSCLLAATRSFGFTHGSGIAVPSKGSTVPPRRACCPPSAG